MAVQLLRALAKLRVGVSIASRKANGMIYKPGKMPVVSNHIFFLCIERAKI
jgi:hypothetical protein